MTNFKVRYNGDLFLISVDKTTTEVIENEIRKVAQVTGPFVLRIQDEDGDFVRFDDRSLRELLLRIPKPLFDVKPIENVKPSEKAPSSSTSEEKNKSNSNNSGSSSERKAHAGVEDLLSSIFGGLGGVGGVDPAQWIESILGIPTPQQSHPKCPFAPPPSSSAPSASPSGSTPSSSSSSSSVKPAVHRGVTCDMCDATPITGIRFKCVVCEDYDLCSKCEATRTHPSDHPMIRFVEPAVAAWHSRRGNNNNNNNGDGHCKFQGFQGGFPGFPFGRNRHCGPHGRHGHPHHGNNNHNSNHSGGSHGHHHGNHSHGNHSHGHHHHHHHQHGKEAETAEEQVFPIHAAAAAAAAAVSAAAAAASSAAASAAPVSSGPGYANLGARFVKDLTIFDGTNVDPNTNLVKTWRLRNTGTVAWPEDTKLCYVGGDTMSVSLSGVNVGAVLPGAETDVSVDIVSPPEEGRYIGYYRLVTGNGARFGHRVWIEIRVTKDEDSEAEEAIQASLQEQQQQQQQQEDQVVEVEIAVQENNGATQEDNIGVVDDGDVNLNEEEAGQVEAVQQQQSVEVSVAAEPGAEASAVAPVTSLRSLTSSPTNGGFEDVDSPYAIQETLLKEMGFKETTRNLELLEHYSGDLAKVVARLLEVRQ